MAQVLFTSSPDLLLLVIADRNRYFITVYEEALRDECGWEGGQPCKSITARLEFQATYA
jgi:hypothetical protein